MANIVSFIVNNKAEIPLLKCSLDAAMYCGLCSGVAGALKMMKILCRLQFKKLKKRLDCRK